MADDMGYSGDVVYFIRCAGVGCLYAGQPDVEFGGLV